MYKKLMILLFAVWILSAKNIYAAQTEEDYYDIFEMDRLEEYGDFKGIFSDVLKGDTDRLIKRLDPRNILLLQIRDCAGILKGLIIICMINGLAATLNFGESKNTEYMAFMLSGVMAAGLCLRALKDVLVVLGDFAGMYLAIVGAAVPVTAAALTVSGRVSLAGSSTALIYAGCSILAAAIDKIIIPCISFFAVCGIINSISPRSMLTKLAALIKSFVSVGIRVCAMVFAALIGFERAVTAGADGVIQKTTLSAVKAVPVAGDIFAAGAESVMAVIQNVKSGLGGGLIIFMLVSCMVPLIKILVMTGIFRMCAVLAEPMGDKRIADMIENAGIASGLAFVVMLCLVLVFMGAVAILLFGMGG